jgi:hypothetical protein
MQTIGGKEGVDMELLKSELDIFPFTRFIWRSAEMQERWADKIVDINRLHGIAEYEMVKQKKRKAGTYHIAPFSYDFEFERLQRDGMIWLPIQRTKSYNGFSHKHFPTAPDDPNSSVYGVIATNMEDAELFRKASSYRSNEPTDHVVIGDLLGFPRCCSDFFTNTWPNYYDPIWQAALATDNVEIVADTHIRVRGDYRIYQHLRYDGLRVTSHLPCSFSCKESSEVAKVWIEVMESIDKEATKGLLELMAMPSKWVCYRGVAQVEHPVFVLIANSMPTAKKYTVEFLGGE